MTQPSFACPRCGYTTFLPSDISAGYCPSCRWWTGDSLLGSEDVLAQAEIDGPFATAGVPAHWGAPLRDENGTAYGWSGMVTGDGTGEALPAADYCAEHDLYDCWYAHAEPTRSELETEWFGAPVHVAYDPSWFGAPITWNVQVPRGGITAIGSPSTPPPTYRVARFVEALRRLRRR